ncbi:MAG TPA: multidrug effflux MFS transporter [Bdellovibrio sp.]|uniref:multidrug effflux MFS transporter n=1 Tax=Bdellovibrio sp. TaxID=28201 RepID=UPI002F1EBE38
MSEAKRNNFLLILILGFLTALSPFAIDMYLPAFPGIAKDFGTDVARVSLSLSSYFIGLAVGQVLYGPFLDRYGRRKPLYFGLTIFVLASFGCMTAHNVETLIAFRFIQALGGCAASVSAVAMVRDFFSIKESSKVFSLLVLILGASPLLAPTVGGYLASHVSWHWIFIILSAIALSLIAISFFLLPPDHSADHTVSLKIKPIVKNFIRVLKDRQFSTYTFTGAFAFAGLFVYVAGSPIIFMDIFHVSAQVYGWIFAGLSIGFIGSSQLNILLIRFFKNEHILQFALVGQVLTGVVFLTATLNGWFGIVGTIACFFFYLACVGLTNPNASALALAPFTKNVGSASALMGAIQMAIGALASFVVGLFTADSALPIVMILSVGSMIATIIFLLGKSNMGKVIEAEEGSAIPTGH